MSSSSCGSCGGIFSVSSAASVYPPGSSGCAVLHPTAATASGTSPSASGHQYKVVVNRGVELNQLRLRGHRVDITIRAGATTCQAHKFILSLYSPYLAALLDPNNRFVESGASEIEIKELPEGNFFSEILTYLYTGQINIHEDNVFEYIEICEYLQLEEFGEGVLEGCLKHLVKKLKTCELTTLLKIWDVSEKYGYTDLKMRVMRVLERRLNEFLAKDVFLFLGYEEIKEVLQLRSLCVQSEKMLFDMVMEWAKKKVEPEDENNVQLVCDLVSNLRLSLLHPDYVQRSFQAALGQHAAQQRSPSSSMRSSAGGLASIRSCSDCVYVFEYTKSDTEILGIREFVTQRKEQPTYAFFDPQSPHTAAILNAFTQSKSYFQHYGPMSSTDFKLVPAARQIHAFAGLRRDDDSISSDIRIFDLESGTWEHRGGRMPENLIRFGVVYYHDDFYLFGGLTDEFSSASQDKVAYRGRSWNVSQAVYRLKRRITAGLEQSYDSLPKMPYPRANFTLCQLDNQVYILGNGFCDRFDLEMKEWTLLAAPPGDVGMKPGAAAIGTRVYVFGDRPESDVNDFFYLETSTLKWVQVAQLSLRQNVIDAFAHNGLIYLIGWQRQHQTMIHEYNPLCDEWRLLLTDMAGTVRAGTLINKYVIGDSTFFDKLVPIRHVKHVEVSQDR